MPQARDEAGYVWETDAQGVALPGRPPISGPNAASPRQGTIITDPAAAYATPRAETDLRAAQVRAQTEAAQLPYAATTAQANAVKAQAEAEKARRDLAAQQATASPQQQAEMANLENDEVLAAIDRARKDVNAGFSTGYAARLSQIPLVGGLIAPQNAINLEGSLNTVSSNVTLKKLAQLKQASPTGASGLGSLTEREGALLRDSIAGLGQTQDSQRLLESLAAIEKHYRNLSAIQKGEDPRDPTVATRYGIAVAPKPSQADSPNTPGSAGGSLTLATGGTRTEADPVMRGVNSTTRGMVMAGRPAEEIVSYLNSVNPGYGDYNRDNIAKQVAFRAQNPTAPASAYGVNVENREVPMTATRAVVNAAAQSPVGAYFMNAGDALSMGTLDNMTGNPVMARAGMRAASEENPRAAILGVLSGGALAGAGAEFGAGIAGAGRLAAPVADLAYGAAYGAGSNDDNRLGGAIGGAVAGLGGGILGRGAVRAVGSTATGVTNEAVQYLRSRRIPVTVGQALSQSGRLGRRIARREDRLSGFGGVGDNINALRREGIESFNRAAFDEALAPIGANTGGQIGERGNEAARVATSAGYDRALTNVSLIPDDQFVGDMQGALAAGAGIPRTGPEFQHVVDTRVAPLFDAHEGAISGREMQDVVQGLRGARAGMTGDTMAQDAGAALQNVEGVITDLAERQNPGMSAAYTDANRAYRNSSIVRDATLAGLNTGGVFTPAQLGQAARGNTIKFGGRQAAASTSRPFYDLQRHAQDVLSSKVPDSGTPGRAAEGSLTAKVASAIRNMTNAPLYADSTQAVIQAALLDRPEIARQAGDWLLQRQIIGSLLGRPAALEYGPAAVREDY